MLDDSMIEAEVPRFDPEPALPATPTPGRRGDFGLLDGRWRQVFSTDVGRTWSHVWVMCWRRVG